MLNHHFTQQKKEHPAKYGFWFTLKKYLVIVVNVGIFANRKKYTGRIKSVTLVQFMYGYAQKYLKLSEWLKFYYHVRYVKMVLV